MFIRQLYNTKKPVLSFEVFPPKKEAAIETIFTTLVELAELSPDYISVTYGASGSAQTVSLSKEIASTVQNRHGITALAHLTGVQASRRKIQETVRSLVDDGVVNILALRGDPPQSGEDTGDYELALDLIRDIKSQGDLCVGAACYPEGHIACSSHSDNYRHTKEKQEAGADFFITQLFFDNELFYRFLEGCRKNGVSIPISAGIMPILSRSQIERMIFMCGVSLPSEIIKLLYRYQDNPVDLKKAGIEYSVKQAEDLVKNGVDGIHVYTMNQPAIARANIKRLRQL